jgi:hypothetical protein
MEEIDRDEEYKNLEPRFRDDNIESEEEKFIKLIEEINEINMDPQQTERLKRKNQEVTLPEEENSIEEFWKIKELDNVTIVEYQKKDPVLKILREWKENDSKPETRTADIRGHTHLGPYYSMYEEVELETIDRENKLLMITTYDTTLQRNINSYRVKTKKNTHKKK